MDRPYVILVASGAFLGHVKACLNVRDVLLVSCKIQALGNACLFDYIVSIARRKNS